MSLDVYLDIHCCKKCGVGERVYQSNITHNLNKMAMEAGIYNHLWRPDEIDVQYAAEIIAPLSKGIAKMKRAPAKYRKLNPSNGWGSYEGFVKWCEEYLASCKKYPKAKITVSR